MKPRPVTGGPHRTALLIGASGFVGRHLAASLEESGHRVVPASAGGGEGERCDLTRPEEVGSLVARVRPDAVVNAAGRASVAAAKADPTAAFRVNALGVVNLLEAVRAAAPEARLLTLSSAAVLGPRPDGELPLTEGAAARPGSPYGAAKLAAELACRAYARGSGLRVAVARLFNQVGPGQPEEQAPAEFAAAIAQAEASGASAARVPVGSPDTALDFLDVRDSAAACLAILETGVTGTFNVCSGRDTTLRELAEGLASHSPLPLELVHEPGLAHTGRHRVRGSHERLSRTTGWRPRIPLGDSLGELLEDVRRRRDRPRL